MPPLIYNGVLTVSVCTIDARAVFELFFCADAARVVTPGVVDAAVVERTVVVGRLATVFDAVARDVRDAFVRDAAARDAVVVAVRDVVAAVVAVGRAVTVRAVVAALLRFATFRADVVVDVATARDAAARPVALRGLTAVGTTGVTVCCCTGCSDCSDALSDSTTSSVMYSISGFSAAYCAIIS